MVLSANTYYQGDSAITAMYQGDVLVYELNPPVIIGTILYTSTDGRIVQPRNTGSTYYGANIISNTYRGGQGVIGFDGYVVEIGYETFHELPTLASIIIPDGTISIGSYAFSGSRNLSSVTIPDSVTSIGAWAFGYCQSLSSITIPSGVTSIGIYAFDDCRSLSSVTIPDSVTGLGESIFENCVSLSSVTIGSGVARIDDYVFYLCTNLRDIRYNGTMVQWGNIPKGTDWRYEVPATVVHCSDGDVPI